MQTDDPKVTFEFFYGFAPFPGTVTRGDLGASTDVCCVRISSTAGWAHEATVVRAESDQHDPELARRLAVEKAIKFAAVWTRDLVRRAYREWREAALPAPPEAREPVYAAPLALNGREVRAGVHCRV